MNPHEAVYAKYVAGLLQADPFLSFLIQCEQSVVKEFPTDALETPIDVAIETLNEYGVLLLRHKELQQATTLVVGCGNANFMKPLRCEISSTHRTHSERREATLDVCASNLPTVAGRWPEPGTVKLLGAQEHKFSLIKGEGFPLWTNGGTYFVKDTMPVINRLLPMGGKTIHGLYHFVVIHGPEVNAGHGLHIHSTTAEVSREEFTRLRHCAEDGDQAAFEPYWQRTLDLFAEADYGRYGFGKHAFAMREIQTRGEGAEIWLCSEVALEKTHEV